MKSGRVTIGGCRYHTGDLTVLKLNKHKANNVSSTVEVDILKTLGDTIVLILLLIYCPTLNLNYCYLFCIKFELLLPILFV